jgi:putative transcriptional regulator
MKSSGMVSIRLKEILEERGLTMYWLAQTAGVPDNTLRNIIKKEGQRRIDLTVISRLCAALECEAGEFFEFIPDDEDKAITQLARTKKAKAAKAIKKARKR